MAGYTRADITNQISDANVINAAPLNSEFNTIEAAFDEVSGHNHDGTSAEGAPITVLGPSQDVVITDTVLRPKVDNTVDIGTTSLEFKDLWIDGVANIDSLVADTVDIDAGTIDDTIIGATTPAAGTFTTLAATSATVGGVAVTTASNTQTLTNKTLTTATINSPTISGGMISGITDLAVADGGTGASTPAGALINLGLTAVAAELNILDGLTATTAELNAAALQSNDRIINGNFAIWQRGSSGSTNAYTAADRWINGFIGGTVTQSREVLSFGEKFGVNTPQFILRQSVSGQTLPGHFAITQQRIEGVRSYADETITILGWARRAAGAGNMAVQIRQVFGTGGSPSTDRTVGASSQVTLVSSWQPFAVTLAVPSIVGRTVGTNGDDYLQVTFFSSAGAEFTSTTAALGLQDITVDLWGVHVRIGTFAASDAEDYIAPSIGENLRDCQRYFEKGFVPYEGYQLANGTVSYSAPFKATKRAAPTIAITNEGSANLTGVFTVPSVNGEGAMIRGTKNGSTGYFTFLVSYTAEAEL